MHKREGSRGRSALKERIRRFAAYPLGFLLFDFCAGIAVDATVDAVFLVGQLEDLADLLLGRGDASGVLADHVLDRGRGDMVAQAPNLSVRLGEKL